MEAWLERAAGRRPEQVAIESPEGTLRYEELRVAAGQRAAELARDGVGEGDRVPLRADDPLELALALHACFMLGAAAVPIDRRLTSEEQTVRAAPGKTEPGTAAVMYTSGTTAEPKAVPLSDKNFLASALGSAALLGLDPAERWLCPMPLTHVGGLSIPVRSVIYGTTAVLHGRFETERVLAELMDPERRTTLVSLVPTMLGRLLEAGLERPPRLRWALVGGGPIAPSLLQRAVEAGVPVAPTYGMTEACSQIATFGWSLPGIEVRIAKDEVLVRGPVVAASALSGDGWLHTGDLGALDGRGRLTINGRKAETIVTGGENVAPQEIEAALLAHPDVADAVVIGRPDPEWGEAVTALVVARDGQSVDPEALRTHCRSRLAAFKVPKTVELVDRLPRSAAGKLLRGELV